MNAMTLHPESGVRARRASLVVLVCAVAPVPYPGADVVVPLAVGLVILAALAVDPARRASVQCALPIVLAVLATSSAVWSLLPLNTLRGGGQLLLLAAAAWNVARTHTLDEIVLAAAVAFRMLLVVSLMLALIRPDLGLVTESYEAGAVKGIFNHRNLFAFVSTLALVTAWATRGLQSRHAVNGDLGLALFCLAAGQSQSSFVVVGAVVAAWAVVRVVRAFGGAMRGVLLMITLGGATGGILWAVSSLPLLVEGLGRDVTLTGRTVIWQAVIEAADERPLLGAGWNAVWHDGFALTNRIWSSTGFAIYQAHNGYLDVYFQLGAVGLAILVAIVVTAIVRSVRLATADSVPSACWPLLVTVGMTVANLTESRFPTSIGWLFMCLAYVYALSAGRDRTGLDDRLEPPRDPRPAERGRR